MARGTDHYKTLGVDKKASQEDIKKAYRKLARQYHPDTNKDAGAEERFKAISEAYDTLGDPDKRKKYDRGGSVFGGAQSPFGGGSSGSGGRGAARLRLLLGHPVGHLQHRRRRGADTRTKPATERGKDLETDGHAVVRAGASTGAQVPVSVATHAACTTCRGTGARPGTQPKVCPVCNGRGVEAQGQGVFSITRPCSRCNGTGTVIEDPCGTCGGEGRLREIKRYRVNIPEGVREGSRIRLAGKGEAGLRGGPPGDLYVITHVTESDGVQAQGRQLRGRGADHRRRGARRAPRSRSRRCTARRSCGSRRAPSTAPSSGCAARARRFSAGSGRGDLHYRFVIDMPSDADRRAEGGRRAALEGHERQPARADPAGGGRALMAARRRTRITARVEHDRGVFMISVAAELAEMHPQTLRMYETRGLIEPKRSPKGTRLYSQADVERLRRIQEMTTEWGMNLAGVERVFELEEQLDRMVRKVGMLERRAEQLQEEIARLEEKRESVKAEIVRYEAAPGTSLIPIRHVKRPG